MVFFVICCADVQYYDFTPTECAHRSTAHSFEVILAGFG